MAFELNEDNFTTALELAEAAGRVAITCKALPAPGGMQMVYIVDTFKGPQTYAFGTIRDAQTWLAGYTVGRGRGF